MTKKEKQQRILNTTKAIFMDGKERNKCIKNFNGDFKGIKSQTYPPFWLWSTGPLQLNRHVCNLLQPILHQQPILSRFMGSFRYYLENGQDFNTFCRSKIFGYLIVLSVRQNLPVALAECCPLYTIQSFNSFQPHFATQDAGKRRVLTNIRFDFS